MVLIINVISTMVLIINVISTMVLIINVIISPTCNRWADNGGGPAEHGEETEG